MFFADRPRIRKPPCDSSCSLPDSPLTRATGCVRGLLSAGLISCRFRILLSFPLPMLLLFLHRHEMDRTNLSDVFSEEFTPFLPGSFVYCHPSEVESWTQSVPFGDFTLPSPPESSSDCGSSDSQDMSSQTWSQASQPEEWMPSSAQDYFHLQQPAGSSWSDTSVPVTAQGMQSMDNAAWLSATSGSVDQGLSPALSHESQSTHTLTSLSEPDCMLPPGLDLSFTADPAWDHSGYAMQSAFPQTEQSSVHSQGAFAKSSGVQPFSQGYFPVVHPSMMFAQSGPAYAPRATYPAPAPKRQLLPRTVASVTSLPATLGAHRALRPSVQGQHTSHAPSPSVSSAASQPSGGPQHAIAQTTESILPRAMQGPQMPPGSHGAHHAQIYTQPSASSQASAPAPSTVDPIAQDFSDFIHFDQEEHSIPQAQLRSDQTFYIDTRLVTNSLTSYAAAFDMQPNPHPSVDITDAMVPSAQDASATYLVAGSANSSMATESEEGRHRSHPLYAAEPKEDGLFHCPYKANDPNCPHKPTKLKCNYEYDLPFPTTMCLRRSLTLPYHAAASTLILI